MFLSKYWPSKALLWKDWRLSLPTFVAWAVYTTYFSTLSLVYYLAIYLEAGVQIWVENGHGYEYVFSAFHHMLDGSGATGAVMALLVIIFGAVSLGQERERGTLSLLARMPYARREILLSKVLVGLAQLSLPFVANALFMTVILGINRGVNFPFGEAAVWGWAVRSVLLLSFVLCVTLLASTVSGKTWGAVFLALVMLLFPLGIYGLVHLNVMQWYRTDLMSDMVGLYGYWGDLVHDIAMYLTIPAWLIDFPALLATRSSAYVDLNHVDLVFANRVWAFLHEHTYVLYLALVGLSLGAYAWAQKWFAANQLEHDSELLALPHLRSLIGMGFTVCSALLGGAILPWLFYTEGLWRLAMILLSYTGSATLAWMLVRRFLGTTPASYSGAKRTKSVAALLLTIGTFAGMLFVAISGTPRQLTHTQTVRLLALAEAVMERRTAALVTADLTPLAELSNELARESPELRSREQAAIAQLNQRREALRQRGETYGRSETQLVFVQSLVRQNTAYILALEKSKLYFAVVRPNQPEYTAWEAQREFVFTKDGERWELTATALINGKELPPLNEPLGEWERHPPAKSDVQQAGRQIVWRCLPPLSLNPRAYTTIL